ncbi:acyltransferase [Actinoplanes sp. M2I2]|uniref:acyltransferase family protein n=1 Tax=Actinoplanes sp. M2I2 TaxID=1734444 RepID=UPI0020219C41|nr:acyltransferase family protein [Actinoplanes sp. M2I2]
MTGGARRPELDAIRLVVVLGLVFFHSGLVFDERDDFYVKNAQTTEAITWVAGLGVVWAMPALFLIAGLGSWHSLGRRGTGGFVRERLLRLGVPLVFATLTIVPVPQWLRLRSADPGYDESYPRFLLRFFDVHLSLSNFPFLVRGEDFETGHLWFVVLLLAFSLMLALVARWLPAARLSFVSRRGVFLILPAIPLVVIGALLGMEEAFAGWSRWAYLLFFLYGFVLAGDDHFRTAMRRDAKPAAIIGFVLFGASGLLLGTADGEPFTDLTAHAVAARIVFAAAGWCWLVAILGLLDRGPRPTGPATSDRDSPEPGAATSDGRPREPEPVASEHRPREPEPATSDRTIREPAASDRAPREPGPVIGEPPPRKRRPVLAYLAAAALPLYILHQPIVVTVAYFAVQWSAPMAVKFLAIVVLSFAIMFAVHDLLVRRTAVTRFLFGMR